ncbi:hypothetical protein AKO1_012069 [Acrasis kona]|uniref:Dynein regulatory complex protein 1 C-terminal domain-containing protein n=1 Tax=Acrasis kona TaxID=1008807 RepID=A0AAW2Z9Z3_9EUKA
MNQDIAEELANKLLKADEIITEQQLGLTWIPPEEDFFTSPFDNHHNNKRSGAGGTGTNNHLANGEGSTIGAKDNGTGHGGLNSTSSPYVRRGSVDQQSIATSESRNSNLQGGNQVFISPSSETTKIIMNTLCSSGGFLVEEKVKKALIKLEPDEAKLLKVDSILRTLGIENPEDIQKLMAYFVQIIEENRNPYGRTNTGNGAAQGISGILDENEHNKDDGSLQLAIDDVVKALRKFVEAQQKALINQNRSTKQKKAKILNAEERAKDRRRKEERELWTRMTQVIPDSKYRVWGMLERGLEKYGGILQEREKLISETEHIRKQNNDLRVLLETFMTQKINDELILPPNIENFNI